MKNFNLDRRSLLKGTAGVLPASVFSSELKASSVLNNKPLIDKGLLVNRPRAFEVMDRFNLQGLVALDPINVFYLTNVITIGVKFRSEYPGFATYAKDPDSEIHLVSSASSAWDIANGDRETASLIAYGFGANNSKEYDTDGIPVEPKNASTRKYPVEENAELTPREKKWVNAQENVHANLSANAAWGIAKALKSQGITKGRVAVDDMRIADLLASTDMVNIECVPGYGVFQLIRMVKTEQEIAYQRIGGQNNGDACLATVRSIEIGMTQDEVVQIFRVECAKRGNDMTSFIAGMPGGGLPDGEIVEGKPYLVDAVSHFKQYHGDTARTFILGEPSKEVMKRHKANQTAREAVYDAIKPGVKYSELRKTGYDVMVKSGMPKDAVFVTPHSVGLQHDDNPLSLPQFGIDRIDHVLEENMVLTVDLPYLQVGYGTGHNEDLFRVTKTGYEPLNSEQDPLIIL